MSSNIRSINKSYIQHIDSLKETLPLTMVTIQSVNKKAQEKFEDFKSKHIEYDTVDGRDVMLVPIDYDRIFQKIDRRLKNTFIAQKVIPRSFLVSLVSQFDAFVGSLANELLNAKPEIVSSSDRVLTYSDLKKFSSLEEAQKHIIDKEIDSLLRESHSSLIEELSKKFDIKIDPKKELWTDFIEITERRNLFVHSDGKITNQYLSVCKNHNVDLNEEYEVGTELQVSRGYFKNAFLVMHEMGVKLGQVLWRKILPDELENADEQLVFFILHLLKDGEYELALNICDFGIEKLPRLYSDEVRRILFINKSIALRDLEKKEKSQEVVNKLDWGGWSSDFKLAVSIINDQYQESYRLMKNIGNNHDRLGRYQYKHWPLFKHIREEERFKEIYEEIFEIPFSVVVEEENDSSINGQDNTQEEE